MTQSYDNQNAWSGDSIFEDVYVYGKFNYDFSGDNLTFKNVHIKENLFVGGISTFVGQANFLTTVFIEELDVNFLDVKYRFDVGWDGEVLTGINTGPNPGRVGVANTAPFTRFQVGGPNTTLTSSETSDKAFTIDTDGHVGLGTTRPGGYFVGMNTAFTGKVKLDVLGPVRIDGHIYDAGESPGVNGYYLNMDNSGIRWIQASPVDQLGILVQDESVYVPNPGAAQTFSVLNFCQSNSGGLGTDNAQAIADPANPTMIARILTKDLWGYDPTANTNNLTEPIFRMTKVGIKNMAPVYDLDILGNLHATSNVQFDDILTVNGNTLLKGTLNVRQATDLDQTLNVDGDTTLKQKLDVDGATTLKSTLDVTDLARFNSTQQSNTINDGAVHVDGGVGIKKKLNVGGAGDFKNTLNVDDATTLGSTLDVTGATTLDLTLDVANVVNFNDTTEASDSANGGALTVDGGTGIQGKLFVGKETKIESASESNAKTDGALVVTGGVGIGARLNVGGKAIIESQINSTDKDTGALVVEGGVGIEENTNIGGNLGVTSNAKIGGTLELEDSIIDKSNNTGFDAVRVKNDYRLSSIGAGVSWRPSGVETENAIWVTVDGDDTNTGFLEGDAKRTIGAAAAIAREGDTIIIRSGTYTENNPIGLRTDVTVSGEDLRLVTIIPQNRTKDVFHVRRGCLIQNVNFSGPPSDGQGGVSIAHTGAGAVAFPPTQAAVTAGQDFQAVVGYTEFGPANEGSSGRWKSPYIRNCTNFMSNSIGMKINGDYANADFSGVNNLGQDLKSMVCDAFTQYNEAGIGVSLSNNAYAQLVSIFTIASEIGISCVTGGQCDLTNSNSSFGNIGLKADGVGATEFTGTVDTDVIADSDSFPIRNLKDSLNRFRKPFDGQGLFFKINLADYLDTTATGIITAPLQLIRSIKVINGGNAGDYSSAAPPIITVPNPLGPESIKAEFSANVSAAGTITSVDVISSGRNFLPNQSFEVSISGAGNAQLEADTDPIFYTVSSATEPTNLVGLTTVTFNEFVPYAVNSGVDIELVRISRIITSSHSFEYIGAGTDINKANPFQGGEPVPANEVIAINGGQVPFTSTDQKGNFRIGDGLTIDQTTSTIRGRDFNRAIQAQLTPLILALR